MNLRVAMALSGNNKAEGINEKGQKIIVQQRYQGCEQWLHVWLIVQDQILTAEQDLENEYRFNEDFQIDPSLDYWRPI